MATAWLRACRSRQALRPAAFLALALLAAACGGDAEGPRGDESYFPHADGFGWTYRVVRPNGPPGTLVSQLDGTEALGGVSVQRMRFTSDAGTGQALIRITPERFTLHAVSFFGGSTVLDPPLVALSMPFELGDRFEAASDAVLGLVAIDVDMSTRVEGHGEVTVAGVVYPDAFRLRATVTLGAANFAIEVPATIWVARGVGAVRAEFDVPPNPLVPVSGRLTGELLEAGP
jgi:hypothetical protein